MFPHVPLIPHRIRQNVFLRLFFPLFPVLLHAQSAPPTTDSTKINPDTLQVVEYRLIPGIGVLAHTPSSSFALHSEQFIRTDSYSTGNVLATIPGIFYRELGQPGQPNQLWTRGVDGRGITVLLDGRPMAEPVTGSYNLNDIPFEYVERIETLTGSESLATEPNAGGMINFVTHQYDNVRPLTKIRYVQGPFGHLLSDGIFAQNVSRQINVMLGFQRHVTDGRFANSKHEAWNVRTRIRYNHSRILNFTLSDFYTKSSTGLNGGVRFDQSPSLFDELTARVNSPNASQSISRRDVTLLGVGSFFSDSTVQTKFSLYYTTYNRDFEDRGEALSTPFSEKQRSSFWGINGRQFVPLPFASVEATGRYESRRSDPNASIQERTEGYGMLGGKLNVNFEDILFPIGFIRYETLRGQSIVSAGASLSFTITPSIRLFGGYSKSSRLPTIQEAFWSDSTVARRTSIKEEKHKLLEIGTSLRIGDHLNFSVSGYRRIIADAIVFHSTPSTRLLPNILITNVPDLRLQGVIVQGVGDIDGFRLTSSFTFTDVLQSDSTKLVVPRWISTSEASFRGEFFTGALDATLAVRLKAVSRQHGLGYDPRSQIFFEQNDFQLGSFAVVDLYTVLKLGDAFVSLTWENVTNTKYMLAPLYPMLSRNVRLGVNWQFID